MQTSVLSHWMPAQMRSPRRSYPDHHASSGPSPDAAEDSTMPVPSDRDRGAITTAAPLHPVWRRLRGMHRRVASSREHPKAFRPALRSLSSQLIRFGFVGATGLVIGLAVLNASMLVVRAFLLANMIAFVFAASWNFLLNRFVTFPPTDRPIWRQWLEYLMASLSTACLNWVVAVTLYHQLAFFHTHYNAAALVGTAVAAGANFLLARIVVFRYATCI